MMEGGEGGLPDGLSALHPLEAVREHRSRITCTLLAWQALQKAGAPRQ